MVMPRIHWKLVSSEETDDFVILREYECPVPHSHRKYHLYVVITPEGEYRSYSII